MLSSTPNVVLYFGTASVPTSASALDLPITCSWARSASISLTYVTVTSASFSDTASYALNVPTTASFALTASIALNASPSISSSWSSASLSASIANTASVMSAESPFTTVTTNSIFWITASFAIPDHFISLPTAGLYYFTCSNPPSAGNVSSTTMFISHSAAATSSLVFPGNWSFLGTVPTYISSSKIAVLSLKAYGPQVFVGAFAVQY